MSAVRNDESATNKVARGFGMAATLRTFGRASTYVVQVILARSLGPEGFGIFAIGWTVLRLFAIVGHLGLDFGVIHFGSLHWEKDARKLRGIFLLSAGGAFLSGAFFGAVLYGLSPWLAERFFQKPELEYILRGFALAFPLATTLRVFAATSSISGNMFCGGFAEDAAQPLLQIIVFLIMRVFNPEIAAAIYSTVLSYVVALGLGFACVTKTIPNLFTALDIGFENPELLFKHSLTTISAVAVGTFNLWGDRLIVGYYSNSADTGIYQSISLLTMLTAALISGLKATIAPAASKLFHQEKRDELKALIAQVNRLIAYLFAPMLLVVALVPADILEIVFGVEYKTGAAALLTLTLGQAFYLANGVVDQFFIAAGKQQKWFQISFLIFILTLALDALLVPRMGLMGAALTSLLLTVLMSVAAARSARKNLGFELFGFHHIKILSALVVSGIATLAVLNVAHPSQPLYRIGMAAVVSSSLFFFSLIKLGFAAADIQFLRQFIRKA